MDIKQTYYMYNQNFYINKDNEGNYFNIANVNGPAFQKINVMEKLNDNEYYTHMPSNNNNNNNINNNNNNSNVLSPLRNVNSLLKNQFHLKSQLTKNKMGEDKRIRKIGLNDMKMKRCSSNKINKLNNQNNHIQTNEKSRVYQRVVASYKPSTSEYCNKTNIYRTSINDNGINSETMNKSIKPFQRKRIFSAGGDQRIIENNENQKKETDNQINKPKGLANSCLQNAFSSENLFYRTNNNTNNNLNSKYENCNEISSNYNDNIINKNSNNINNNNINNNINYGKPNLAKQNIELIKVNIKNKFSRNSSVHYKGSNNNQWTDFKTNKKNMNRISLSKYTSILNSKFNNYRNNVPNKTFSEKKTNENKIENNIIIDISEIIVAEYKILLVWNNCKNLITCQDECFEFINFYFNSKIPDIINRIFRVEKLRNIVESSIKFMFICIITAYDVSFHPIVFSKINICLNTCLDCAHQVIILIAKYCYFRINKNEDPQSFWIKKLRLLLEIYSQQISDDGDFFKDFSSLCCTMATTMKMILTNYQQQDIVDLYNSIKELTCFDIDNIYREKIHKNINNNGSIFASSNYFKGHKISETIPVPYLKYEPSKPYTLVLDLDETLIHFKPTNENQSKGTLLFRPFLNEFFEGVMPYYELVIFTAAIEEYADPIIDTIENGTKIFDYRLYRKHTTIIDNDFVKDLNKLGRNLKRTIIVDNMPQNFKLNKENGINIRPFWGKESNDYALSDLMIILEDIAEKRLDVRKGIAFYRDQIASKITASIGLLQN